MPAADCAARPAEKPATTHCSAVGPVYQMLGLSFTAYLTEEQAIQAYEWIEEQLPGSRKPQQSARTLFKRGQLDIDGDQKYSSAELIAGLQAYVFPADLRGDGFAARVDLIQGRQSCR